jgi:hypothetical protein
MKCLPLEGGKSLGLGGLFFRLPMLPSIFTTPKTHKTRPETIRRPQPLLHPRKPSSCWKGAGGC